MTLLPMPTLLAFSWIRLCSSPRVWISPPNDLTCKDTTACSYLLLSAPPRLTRFQLCIHSLLPLSTLSVNLPQCQGLEVQIRESANLNNMNRQHSHPFGPSRGAHIKSLEVREEIWVYWPHEATSAAGWAEVVHSALWAKFIGLEKLSISRFFPSLILH